MSLQLKELLDAPLFGVEGDVWKNQPRRLTEEYEFWIDAQFYSNKASDMFANFKDVIFPLEKTRKQNVLDTMWKNINLVCCFSMYNFIVNGVYRIINPSQVKTSTRFGT